MENKFNYFFGSENEQYLFLQMPVMLIKDERFRGLSDSAKILYSLFLNRTSLSAKNGWLDDEGRVYIIYTVDEIMADLKCHEGKSNKSMNELKEIGLVKTVRRGLGKPNMIYVMNFATDLKYRPRKPEPEKETESPMEPLICDFHNSGIAKKTNHEMRKSQTINIYSNKNNLKEDLSIYPAQAGTEADHQRPAEPKPIDMIDKQQPKISETLEAGSEQNPIEPMAAPFACAGNQNSEIPKMTKETIADKIYLAELISEYPDKEKKILELYDIICEVLTAGDAEKMRVAKGQLPAAMVKQEFSKLGKGHILYVLDCLEKNGGNIRDNAKGYVLTSLYNSGHSVGFYMPHSQSAFKDGDNSNPELKGKYDIRKFFESNLRKPLNV